MGHDAYCNCGLGLVLADQSGLPSDYGLPQPMFNVERASTLVMRARAAMELARLCADLLDADTAYENDLDGEHVLLSGDDHTYVSKQLCDALALAYTLVSE